MDNTMDRITTIDVPFPEAPELTLRIAVGACRIQIAPGDDDRWVTGTYEDPSNAIPMRLVQEGGTVKISQEVNWPENFGSLNRPPIFDLKLGKARPYALVLEGGASESEAELGGLPLRQLIVKYGAGQQEIDFSAPNPEIMQELSVSVGAAALEMENLANANFVHMKLDGGAAGYELDFGGILQRDAEVKINTGMSGVVLSVPASTPAKISVDAVMGGPDAGDGFMKKDGAFWNQAALAGGTPMLTVEAHVVMGGIRLQIA